MLEDEKHRQYALLADMLLIPKLERDIDHIDHIDQMLAARDFYHEAHLTDPCFVTDLIPNERSNYCTMVQQVAELIKEEV